MRKTLALLFIVVCSTTLFGQIKHRFLLADEGTGKIVHIDQFNPANNWSMQPAVGWHRDMQLVGKNRVMVTLETEGKYCELNLANGAVLKTSPALVKAAHGMSAIRLPNGNTQFIGVDIVTGLTGTTLVEYDSTDKLIRKFSWPNTSGMRLARRTPAGTFLFGTDTQVCEGDSTGRVIWQKTVPGAGTVYQAVRLANGNTLATNGYGKALYEINSSGTVRKTYGGATQPGADSIVPNFYCGFQVLKNKHIVVANWEGHGPGHGGTGIQVLEYDTAGTLVWRFKDPTLFSSIHGLLFIDSLDTKYLYSDKNGGVLMPDTIAAPVTPPGIPSLGLPADTAKNQPLSLSLTWNAVTGAATYQVQLSTGSTFATTIVNDSTLTATTKAVGPLTAGTTCYWRVRAKNGGGAGAWSTVRSFKIASTSTLLPVDFACSFSGITGNAKTVGYSIPKASRVAVRIYTVQGKLIKTLVDSYRQPGHYRVPVSSKTLPHGYFILDFRAGDLNINKRISNF